MIILGIFFLILQLGDLITTNLAIKNGCQEANPLLKESLEGSGFPLSLAIVKIGMSIFLIIVISVSSMILNVIVLILDILLFVVIINNLIRIPIQKKYNRLFFMESAQLIKFMQFWDIREFIYQIWHPQHVPDPNRWKKRAFIQVKTVRSWIKRIHLSSET